MTTRRQIHKPNQTYAFVAGIATAILVMVVMILFWGRGNKSEPSSPKLSNQTIEQAVSSSEQAAAATDTGISSTINTATNQTGIQVDAIANGDFSSVEGRWVRADGDVIEFSKTGVIGQDARLDILEKLDRGSLRTNYYQDGTIGVLVEFFPAGVSAETYVSDIDKTFMDGSDQGRDRLWLGQSFEGVEDPGAYYYKQ